MTAVNQVLMVFLAAFALILLLFILRSLWTIVTVKYKSHIINKRLDPSSNPNTVTTNVNEDSRTRQIPTISSQLHTRQGSGNTSITTSNPNRQTFPRSAMLSHNRNNFNNYRMRQSRLDALPQRHQNRNPGQHCNCSSHRNSNLHSSVQTPNQESDSGHINRQQVFLSVSDDPPTYDEATKPPTFEESQKCKIPIT